MIAAHIDHDLEYVLNEVRAFERECGTVESFIRNPVHGFCNLCGQPPGPNDRIDYVITSSGSVIWWHRRMKTTDRRCVMEQITNH